MKNTDGKTKRKPCAEKGRKKKLPLGTFQRKGTRRGVAITEQKKSLNEKCCQIVNYLARYATRGCGVILKNGKAECADVRNSLQGWC